MTTAANLTDNQSGKAAVIEATDVVKVYKTWTGKQTPALDGVTLRLEPGTVFGLLGPNGAGKSTLVKIFLGIVHPTSGTARLLGAPTGDPAQRRRVGFLPEAMRLPEWMKARPFLQFMGEMTGLDRSTARQRSAELLEQLGLGGETKPFKEYSKGMQQRLGLAQALLNDPDVLFLDEPTDGLDPVGCRDVRELLGDLRRRGKTIFLTSHALREAERVCDRVTILFGGRVLRSGTLAEVVGESNEYHIRLARDGEGVRTALGASVVRRDDRGYVVRVAGRAELNKIIDHLRAAGVEIECVEGGLESAYMKLVGAEKQ